MIHGDAERHVERMSANALHMDTFWSVKFNGTSSLNCSTICLHVSSYLRKNKSIRYQWLINYNKLELF